MVTPNQEQSSTIRLLILDDRADESPLSRCLLNIPEVSVEYSTRNPKDALVKTLELQPDILIVRQEDAAIVRSLRNALTDGGIVVVSDFALEPYIRRTLMHGARGYVHKSSIVNDLPLAIHMVNRGGYYFSEIVEREIIKAFIASIRPD